MLRDWILDDLFSRDVSTFYEVEPDSSDQVVVVFLTYL